MPESLLRFENVGVTFGDGTQALDGVSFEMHEGETRILLGAAGSGKTVLLKAALGLVPTTSGTVSLFGEDITGKPEA
jgi:ABC-type multidrug transport system ATPase subunit